MVEKLYTIGEIFRLQLMSNYKGNPYKTKSQVSKAVRKLQYRIIHTPFGAAKVLPMSEIKRHNSKYEK